MPAPVTRPWNPLQTYYTYTSTYPISLLTFQEHLAFQNRHTFYSPLPCMLSCCPRSPTFPFFLFPTFIVKEFCNIDDHLPDIDKQTKHGWSCKGNGLFSAYSILPLALGVYWNWKHDSKVYFNTFHKSYFSVCMKKGGDFFP